MLEQFGRSCGLKGTQMGAVFRQECKPCRGPVLELFLKNCSLWEGHMQEQFIKDCSFRERPTVKKGKGEMCEEERVAETSCYKQCNPHSPPAMPLRRGGRGVRGEAELGRKGRLGECPLCFSVSHCFSSSITWQSVVNFPLVELFLPVRVIGK